MLNQLLEFPLFSEERMPPPDFCEWLEKQDSRQREAALERFMERLEHVENFLYKILDIAEGNSFSSFQ